MEPMEDLSAILLQIGIGESVENCVEGIREIIFGMLEGLSETPPFHRLDIEKLTARADACLTVSTARRLYLHADEVNYLDARNGNLSPEDQKMLDFTDILQKMSLLGLGMDGSSAILSNFATKFGGALGSWITGIMLMIGGYVSAEGAAEQSASALMMIRIDQSVVPAVCLVIIAICAMAFSRLEPQVEAFEAKKKAAQAANEA